jgi:O-antigen ligase
MWKYFEEHAVLPRLIKTGLFLSVALLPFSTVYCNASLVTTAALSVIFYIRTRDFQWTVAALPMMIFALSILSFAYTQNVKAGIASLELDASWFFIPLIFVLARSLFTTRLRDQLLTVFAAATLLVCTGSYVLVALRSGQFGPAEDNGEGFNYLDPFSRLLFSEVTNIHPSYLSVYLLFTIVIIARVAPIKKTWIRIMLIIIALGFMLILSAKNQLVLGILVLTVLIWNMIRSKLIYKVGIVSLVVAIAVLVASMREEIRYRFREELKQTLGERVILWSASLEVVRQHPVFGVGIGDTDDAVNAVLQQRGHGYLNNFNSHNQYLDYWLMLGLIGLGAFVIILVMPLRFGDFPFNMFIGIMALSMLTESMMYRQKGLVFFLLLYGICGAVYPLKKDLLKKKPILPAIP